MKITTKSTNLDLTPALNEYLEMKIGSLSKYLEKYEKEGVVEARVELARTTNHHYKGDVFMAEADIRLPGKILRADAETEDIRSAIDLLENKLTKQIEKYKDKAAEY